MCGSWAALVSCAASPDAKLQRKFGSWEGWMTFEERICFALPLGWVVWEEMLDAMRAKRLAAFVGFELDVLVRNNRRLDGEALSSRLAARSEYPVCS